MKELCPDCEKNGEEVELSTRWHSGPNGADGRWLRKFCDECARYKGEPYVPEIKEVPLIKRYYTTGWMYEMYDQFGHTAIISRSDWSKEECFEEAAKEHAKRIGKPGYETCTVVIFPFYVEVEPVLVIK